MRRVRGAALGPDRHAIGAARLADGRHHARQRCGSTTCPRPARVAATASAEAAAPSEPKRRGRPAKVASPAAGRIPTANSEADAIRQLEERKFQRAEGTRQDGLFD